jgi:ferredoxin
MGRKSKKRSKIQVFRLIVLASFIVLVTVLAVGHQLSIPGFGPIDAICPFGGLETIYRFLANGGFLQRTFTSNLVLLVGIIILGIIFGRYFCGWICMLGGLQEYFRLLGKKIFKRRRFTIPEKIDNPLRYTKYLVLAVVLFFTWKTGELIIRPYDPFAAYAHLAAGLQSVWEEFAVGLIILVVSLIASMFYDRVFCKYLCPLGAFLGILTKTGIYRIKRDNNTCTDCRICDKACPVNLNVSNVKAITSPECINCLECVTDCPTKKDTLFPAIFNKFTRPLTIGILGIVIYIGIIGASKITGYWESVNATLEERAEEGLLTPDDIKGSNTISEVAVSFNLDLNDLYKNLNLDISKVPKTTRLREIKDLIGSETFEAEQVREVVKAMLGMQVEESLPAESNVDVLPSERNVDTSHAVPKIQQQTKNPPDQGESTEKKNQVDEGEFKLEGTMNIHDIAKGLGIPEPEVIKKLGLPNDFPPDRPLRDLREEYGYTIPELRAKINN